MRLEPSDFIPFDPEDKVKDVAFVKAIDLSPETVAGIAMNRRIAAVTRSSCRVAEAQKLADYFIWLKPDPAPVVSAQDKMPWWAK